MADEIDANGREAGAKGSGRVAPARGSRREADLTLGPGNWDAYAVGYKEAGDLLTTHVGDSPWRSNVLGFPLVYLYRHYVELRLKELLVLTARLLGLPQQVPKGHGLLNLWQRLRPTLEQIWPGAKGDFDTVEDGIEQLAELDPSSQKFRYPVYRDGRSTLQFTAQRVSENRHIDVVRLKETVDAIDEVLDACSTEILERLQANGEALAEYHTKAAQYQDG